MMEERKKLPIFASRDEILQKIEMNSVVLVRGETGSGKTTQVRGRGGDGEDEGAMEERERREVGRRHR